MPSTNVAVSSNPQPKPAKTLKVTRKVRAAIEQMVWYGLKRAEAAQVAGLTDHSLYVALRSPHVKAAYLAELDVLRTSERARDIHTLNEVRDQKSNQMARVAAIKAKWQIEDGEANGSNRANSLPGLQIVIMQGGSAAPPTIDVTPSELAHD